jgi:hypothetical protein
MTNSLGWAVIIGGAFTLSACQTHTPGSIDAMMYDQWKVIYKACMKSTVHGNAAIALYIDVGAVSRGCAGIAREAVSRTSTTNRQG